MWVYVLTVYFSFLSFSIIIIIIVCFVSLRKEKKKKEIEPIRLSCCVHVSQRDLFDVCVFFSKKKRGERIKKIEFPVCLCFRIICRLFLSSFLWVDAVFFLCYRLFPYLFIKRLCARARVCVYASAFIICCVFAYSFIHFILFFFLRLLNSLNLFTTKRKKKRFFFVCVLISTRLLCVFHYAFRWVSFSLYICVYVCCVLIHCHWEKTNNKEN